MTVKEHSKKMVTGQPCLDTEGCKSSDAMCLYFPYDEAGKSFLLTPIAGHVTHPSMVKI